MGCGSLPCEVIYPFPLLEMIEVGFSQAEFRVSEDVGSVTIPFQILNPADPSTLPNTFFISLTVSVLDGTAMCKELMCDAWTLSVFAINTFLKANL